MQIRTLGRLVAFLLIALVATDLAAQGRGGGGGGGGRGGGGGSGKGGKGGGRGGRFDAVRERLNPNFVVARRPGTGQVAAGGDYFASIGQIQAAAKQGHLSVLYLYDSSNDGGQREKFEEQLLTYRNEKVAASLRAFVCLKLDLGRHKDLLDKCDFKIPAFIGFNAKRERVDVVSLPDYKISSGALVKLLNKTAKGHAKIALAAFVKKYRSLMNDLDQLERDKKTVRQYRERAEAEDRPSKKKLKKADKDEEAIKKREKKIEQKEQKLLAAIKAPPGGPAPTADSRS